MPFFKKTAAFPFHPFLISTFAGLSLYVNNIHFIQPLNMLLPLFLILLFCASCLGLLYLVVKNLPKAALLCSLFFLFFFSYADVYNWAATESLGYPLQRHSIVFPVWLTGLLGGSWLISRLSLPTATAISGIINLSSGGIFLFHLAQIGLFHLNPSFSPPETSSLRLASLPKQPAPAAYPDIIYLVLDGYGRQDVLQKYYGLDNRAFTGFLQSAGFYLANQSTSNYCRTAVSVASSLNFDYIQNLMGAKELKEASYQEMAGLIERSQVISFLKNQDYRIVSYESGHGPVDIRLNSQFRTLNHFSSEVTSLLLNMSPLFIIHENAFLYNLVEKTKAFFHYTDPYLEHRNRVLYTLEDLPKAFHAEGPTFVFADILAGHPPFIFSGEGDLVRPDRAFGIKDGTDFMALRKATREEYIEGYKAQVSFINKKLGATIAQVLAQRKRPVVFIIQGDHGPGSQFDQEDLLKTNLEERFSILNAIYFSDQDTSSLSAGLTPVNTFRIVLNKYFGQALPLAENHHYYSTGSSICDFTPVTEKVRPKK